MSAPLTRQQLPDALRAIAMVSVLVVNAIGYAVAPWGPILGERTPQDSAWAAATQGLVGALLQGKGYAMLAFVFGMSLWLASRGRSRPEALRRGKVRQRRLLHLGILHGVFVYFGDILTLYALVGRRLLPRLHLPWGALRRHLWRALGWALLAKLVSLWLFVGYGVDAAAGDAPSLSTVQGAWPFLRLNAGSYAFSLAVALLLAAPVTYLCMACGVAAARLRLLTHRRWRRSLWQFLRRAGPPLLALSVAYGGGCALTNPMDTSRPWIDALGDLIGLPLAACYVAALSLASAGGRAPWCAWFSPLGQRTLTLYVGHSLLCLALLSGAGWSIAATTAQTVLSCLVLWAVALTAARHSGRRRWPLEAWVGRR